MAHIDPDGPPDTLDVPLELTPSRWTKRDIYLLLSGLVIPRPIAWVSTVDEQGVRNVAPHSFFNMMSSQPPHVAFSSQGIKDTLRNLRAVPEFVVNIVSMDLAEAMNASATNAPPDVDEFDAFGIDAAPSSVVRPPRVASSRAHLECRVTDEVSIGNGHLVIGEVVHIHVDPSVWRDGRVQPDLLDPVCRLAGTRYASLGELFTIERRTWDEVEDLPVDQRWAQRT